MAKFKPAGKSKKGAKPAAGALPCVILLLVIFAIVGLLFYMVLRSSS